MGGARGIGAAIARAMADHGAEAVIGDLPRS
jgi:NAD(P)-dependent dehydrogenase (short-subunit alcohol dehydrogenase family)